MPWNRKGEWVSPHEDTQKVAGWGMILAFVAVLILLGFILPIILGGNPDHM